MPSRWRLARPILLSITSLLATTLPAAALSAADRPAATQPANSSAVNNPKSIDDLRTIQKKVQKTVKDVRPAVVGLTVPDAQGRPTNGSGVIVSEDGLVLTVGHVIGEPGKLIVVIMPDGTQHRAITLGVNSGVDCGMVKITDPGKYPFVKLGKSADVKPGEWCLTIGHPNGYQAGRPPVVRLGRILVSNAAQLASDCATVSGDSGAAVFDLQGRLIGVHTRIGGPIIANLHVPIDIYRRDWDKLVKGDSWGTALPGAPSIAIQGRKADKGYEVTTVTPGSHADRAGIKTGDVITTFNGQKINDYNDLIRMLSACQFGQVVELNLLRGEQPMTVKVTIEEAK